MRKLYTFLLIISLLLFFTILPLYLYVEDSNSWQIMKPWFTPVVTYILCGLAALFFYGQMETRIAFDGRPADSFAIRSMAPIFQKLPVDIYNTTVHFDDHTINAHLSCQLTGFWVRRIIDGSSDELMATLLHYMRPFDEDWVDNQLSEVNIMNLPM